MTTPLHVLQVLKAKLRIPQGEFPYGTTFFSHKDVWLYQAVLGDGRTCEACLEYDMNEEFWGDSIRGLFPDLEIEDINTISVNAHINCRCYLVRYIDVPEEEQ